jgi:hypothetical protein
MDTGLLGSRERGKAEKAETLRLSSSKWGSRFHCGAALTRAAFSL